MKRNEGYVKGLLFEVVLKELVKKSGFTIDEHISQANVKNTKLHGRSGVHQIDVLGVFRLGIPFVNPLLLMGEAKNFNKQVGLKEAREFLGTYIDIVQYNRINTKSRSSNRSEEILQPKYTYCPVYFSMKGYQQSAQHFMFAHGINFFSYENSEIMERLAKKIAGLLTQIRFQKMKTDDFKNFRELLSINNIPQNLKKDDFKKAHDKLVSYINSVNSFVGVLDRRFPIHILTEKKTIPKKPGKINLEIMQVNSFKMKTQAKRQIGQFSLPRTFISDYLRVAKKQGSGESAFQQIDIIASVKDNLVVINFKIDETSRSNILTLFKQQIYDRTQLPSLESTESLD
jgi:hypothetical protein